MKKAQFGCMHDAGRSRTAEVLSSRLGPSDVRAECAGSAPARKVRENGIDLSAVRARKLLPDMQLRAGRAVTPAAADSAARERLAAAGCVVAA